MNGRSTIRGHPERSEGSVLVLVTREGATSVVPYVLALALAAEVSTFLLVQKKE
jgi:hypothetical protein